MCPVRAVCSRGTWSLLSMPQEVDAYGQLYPPGGSSSPFSSRYLAASVISFILASASIYFACIEVEWSGVMTSELPAANAAAVDSKRARQLSML
jgi:hypothetical protein